MPELPEVETIKVQLNQKIIGKIIKSIDVLEKKQLIGKKERIIGKKIISVKRFGKIIVIKLRSLKDKKNNNQFFFLNIHLKLTGEILYADDIKNATFKEIIPFTGSKTMPGKTTRIIIEFTDGSGIFFNDLRKFGWIKITNQPEVPRGVDILSKRFTLNYFSEIIKKSNKPVKLLIMDQEKITGVGNIYANDSLFLAKINPLRKANSLTIEEISKLYFSIKKIIEQAIKNKGSSGADEAFVQIDGTKGKHQNYFLVYQRENKPCLVCQTLIKRIKQNNRSSFFCPHCQPY